MEAVIAGGLGVLSLQIAGVSIKEILPTMLGFSWKLYLTYKHSTLMTKLSKMVISYTKGQYPHKDILKKTKTMIKELFKRHTKAEIVQTITYLKSIKDLFYAVNFDCPYWEANMKTLLTSPEKMRDYMIKKIYIERIKDIIVVKLYNNILSKEDLKELERDLLDAFMTDRITIDMLDKIVSNIENNMREQYNTQKVRYDKDFNDEKGFMVSILENSGNGLPRVARAAIRETQDIVNECKNEIGADNYTSKFLKRTRSLSKKSSDLDIVEEDKPSSSGILGLLN